MREPTFRTGNRCLSSLPLLDLDPAIITTASACLLSQMARQCYIGLQMAQNAWVDRHLLYNSTRIDTRRYRVGQARTLSWYDAWMLDDQNLSSWCLGILVLNYFCSLPGGRRLFVTLSVACIS